MNNVLLLAPSKYVPFTKKNHTLKKNKTESTATPAALYGCSYSGVLH